MTRRGDRLPDRRWRGPFRRQNYLLGVRRPDERVVERVLLDLPPGRERGNDAATVDPGVTSGTRRPRSRSAANDGIRPSATSSSIRAGLTESKPISARMGALLRSRQRSSRLLRDPTRARRPGRPWHAAHRVRWQDRGPTSTEGVLGRAKLEAQQLGQGRAAAQPDSSAKASERATDPEGLCAPRRLTRRGARATVGREPR